MRNVTARKWGEHWGAELGEQKNPGKGIIVSNI